VGLRAGLDTEDTGENPLPLPGMLQVKLTLRLFSHWRNHLHENDHMRPPIFLACNRPITFHKTFSTDAAETSVSVTFAITVACDRTCQFLGDFSCIVT
jgi:hypothetical protein